MKVNVLIVDDVKIKRWRWWSNWIDVAVYNWNICPFLIPMSISRNKRKAVSCRAHERILHNCCVDDVGDLTQMKSGGK